MKWYKIKTLPEDTLCSHSHSLGSDLRYVITPSNNNSNLRHWASLVSQLVKNPPATQETPDRFLDREDPLKKGQVSRSRTPGFPSWLRGWRICLQRGRPGFYPWVGKIPWRRELLDLEISCDKSNQSIFCYGNEVTFGKLLGNLKMETGCYGSQPYD